MKKSEVEDLWSYLSRDLSETVKREILIPSGRNGMFVVRDYVSACCFLAEVYKVANNKISTFKSKSEMERELSSAVRWRMKYYTPCLPVRWDELKDDKKSEVLDSIDWIATEKVHGLRGWLMVTKDGCVHLFGRGYSDIDCGLVDYWSTLDGVKRGTMAYGVDVEVCLDAGCNVSRDLGPIGMECDGTMDRAEVLEKLLKHEDCKELMRSYEAKYGRSLIRMQLILPLYWNGVNYVERTIGEAMDVYDEALRYGQELGLSIDGIRRKVGSRIVKEVFVDTIIGSGGEGVVFYNRRGPYCTSENRNKDSFVKLKHGLGRGLAVAMDDTIDAWIGGISDGDLVCYVIVNDAGQMYKKVIGYAPIDEGLQRRIDDCGGIEGIKGSVVELSGKCLRGKWQLLDDIQIVRWRDDKGRNGCVYNKEWLDSQTIFEK